MPSRKMNGRTSQLQRKADNPAHASQPQRKADKPAHESKADKPAHACIATGMGNPAFDCQQASSSYNQMTNQKGQQMMNQKGQKKQQKTL